MNKFKLKESVRISRSCLDKFPKLGNKIFCITSIYLIDNEIYYSIITSDGLSFDNFHESYLIRVIIGVQYND